VETVKGGGDFIQRLGEEKGKEEKRKR